MRDMTDLFKRQDAFREKAREALPFAKAYEVNVSDGDGGYPYRLTVSPLTPGHEGRSELSFTFFDDADLRRVLMSLGRGTQEALERRAAALAAEHQSVKAEIEAQASALARLEAER